MTMIKTCKKMPVKILLKSKSTLSKEKVEKVVKDPSTPMIKKYFIASEEIFSFHKGY